MKNKEDLLVHRLNVRVDKKTIDKIKEVANEKGITQIDLIRQMINFWFNNNK